MINLGSTEVKDFALGSTLLDKMALGSVTVHDPYSDVSGTLPLTYTSRASQVLKNYRMYGTASGSGVATENLWNSMWIQGAINSSGIPFSSSTRCYTVIQLQENVKYTFSCNQCPRQGYAYDENNVLISRMFDYFGGSTAITFTTPSGTKIVRLVARNLLGSDYDLSPSDISETMVTQGETTPPSYIPYGYKIPLSVSTENLFDETYPGIGSTEKYLPIKVGTGAFTLTTTCPRTYKNAAVLFFFAGNVSTGASTQTNGVWSGHPLTVQSSDGYVTIAYRILSSVSPADYSTRLTYDADYTLYIGSSKLGEDDFVDYASQKVYRLKEVHTDTVTINGIEWDILGYDHDEVYKADGVTRAQHTVTIQTHDALPNMQFDAPEAFYYAENGLTAGTYYFTIDPTYQPAYNTYSGYQFTLTQDVPAKGVLTLSWGTNTQASGMKISSYATAGATTAIESNIAVSEGTTGTNLGQLTSAGDPTNNLNSISRARYGSNNYQNSAIRQLLNSNSAAGTFWTSQTKWDRPPSWLATADGFLYGADSNFISVLGTTKKITALNTVTDGGGTVTTSEKMFLLSTTEAYCGGSEGTAYSFFKNYSDLSAAGGGADTNRIKYRNNAAKVWWLRSPDPSSAYLTRLIYTSGALHNGHYSNYSSGVVPACCIILDDLAENDYLKSVFLKPIDPPSPLPTISAVQGENVLSSTETVGTVTVKGRIKASVTA